MSDETDIRLLAGAPTDLPLIFELERAYIADHEPQNVSKWEAALHRHLEQWVRCLPDTVVATAGDEKAGYTFWERGTSHAILASIHVKPGFRRRGIGSLLLRRFEDDAVRSGFGVAELHVFEGNPAGTFYRAAGYAAIETAASYIVMRKTLDVRRDALQPAAHSSGPPISRSVAAVDRAAGARGERARDG